MHYYHWFGRTTQSVCPSGTAIKKLRGPKSWQDTSYCKQGCFLVFLIWIFNSQTFHTRVETHRRDQWRKVEWAYAETFFCSCTWQAVFIEVSGCHLEVQHWVFLNSSRSIANNDMFFCHFGQLPYSSRCAANILQKRVEMPLMKTTKDWDHIWICFYHLKPIIMLK